MLTRMTRAFLLRDHRLCEPEFLSFIDLVQQEKKKTKYNNAASGQGISSDDAMAMAIE